MAGMQAARKASEASCTRPARRRLVRRVFLLAEWNPKDGIVSQELACTRLLERRISLPICHTTYGLICRIQRDRAGMKWDGGMDRVETELGTGIFLALKWV